MAKEKLRLLTQDSLRTYQPTPQVGNYLSARNVHHMDARARKGLHHQQHLHGQSGINFAVGTGRRLTPDQLWRIYMTTPDIRAAVDSIVRRIATWDWTVKPTVKPDDPRINKALKTAESVEKFLKVPSTDGKTWQMVNTMMGIDTLVFDAGAAEIVKNRGGGLVSLCPLHGPDFLPIIDRHGNREGYQQFLFASSTQINVPNNQPFFNLDELYYIQLFSNTRSPLGLPIIDTILNEAVAMLVASDHVVLALDANEIPPGLLVLGGIADQAVRKAKADLTAHPGQDQRLRILNSPSGADVSAEWIELRRNPREVQIVDVVEGIRRTIWRSFGVFPVEMGSEDSNRAHAAVQLDVSSSHLITPFLEAIQGQLNEQVVPLAAGSPELAELVTFEFDRDQKLTAEEREQRAKTHNIYIRSGVLSINEARAELNHLPVEGGDINRIEVGGLLVPVNLLADPGVVGGFNDSPASFQDNADDDMGADVQDNDEDVPQPVADAPVEEARRATIADLINELPSEWQSEGLFKNDRTLDLPRLGTAVAGYARRVEPILRDLEREVLAAFEARYKPGELTEERARGLRAVVQGAIRKTGDQWALIADPFYREAGKVGLDAARDIAQAQVLENWEARTDVFQAEAMGYLGRPDGPIMSMDRELVLLISQITAGQELRAEQPEGQGGGEELPEVNSKTGIAIVLGLAVLAIRRQANRVRNWAGRLVQLANEMMVNGLGEVDRTQEGGPQFFVEWVHVGDDRMCPTCTSLGNQGIIPRSDLSTVPGGATECGARCRCVLRVFTAEEVRNR